MAITVWVYGCIIMSRSILGITLDFAASLRMYLERLKDGNWGLAETPWVRWVRFLLWFYGMKFGKHGCYPNFIGFYSGVMGYSWDLMVYEWDKWKFHEIFIYIHGIYPLVIKRGLVDPAIVRWFSQQETSICFGDFPANHVWVPEGIGNGINIIIIGVDRLLEFNPKSYNILYIYGWWFGTFFILPCIGNVIIPTD